MEVQVVGFRINLLPEQTELVEASKLFLVFVANVFVHHHNKLI